MHRLNETSLGRQLTENLIYNYGVGQDDIHYGKRLGLPKAEYKASDDPTLVQYNKRITTEDDRYRIAKANLNHYMKAHEKDYKETLKSLQSWRKNNPILKVEKYLSDTDKPLLETATAEADGNNLLSGSAAIISPPISISD